MGFSTQQFVQAVDPNLVCAVCGGVLEDAVLTPCGHSFCHLCLHTWLARPAALTCPECRAPVTPDSVKPVHPLRNLVRGLRVQCEHSARGCKEVVTLDLLSSHLGACPYGTVQCAGCGEDVLRLELPDHHMACRAIAASVRDLEDDQQEGSHRAEDSEGEDRFEAAWREFRARVQTSKTASHSDVSILLGRIRALETRVEHLVNEVRAARGKNLHLERQYDDVKQQLRVKHGEVLELRDTDLFLQREVARTPDSVARLSLLIARHLLHKPRHLDPATVFSAVRRCYDSFHRAGSDYQHDLHMLLATAYASNWFSATHRLSLKCWLQALTRPVSCRSGSGLFNS